MKKEVPGSFVLAETVKETAFNHVLVRLVVQWPVNVLVSDSVLCQFCLHAPTPAVGDSVARVMKRWSLEVVGTHVLLQL